jgi:hypothetical protein
MFYPNLLFKIERKSEESGFVIKPLKNIVTSITWRFQNGKKESKEEGSKEKNIHEKGR